MQFCKTILLVEAVGSYIIYLLFVACWSFIFFIVNQCLLIVLFLPEFFLLTFQAHYMLGLALLRRQESAKGIKELEKVCLH